jgi:hypothetical protein
MGGTLKVTIALLAALVLIAGCSSGTKKAAAPSVAPSSPTPVTSAATDPNALPCSDANDVMLDIKAIFHGWDTQADLYNAKVSSGLRDDATKLYALEVKTIGSVNVAIHNEAKSLVDLSIAMDAQDANSVSTAATAGNSALAELRGTCGF